MTSRRVESNSGDVGAAINKAVHSDYKPSPGHGDSRSIKQLGSLLSILAVHDVYDAVRPLLIKEKIIGEKDDTRVMRPDLLKALARKWNLHKEPNFWRDNDTPLKLALALVEHQQKLSQMRRIPGVTSAVRSEEDESGEPSSGYGRRYGSPGKDDSTSGARSNAWVKMAAQHSQESEKLRGAESRAGSASDDTGTLMQMLRGTKPLRDSFKPYRGDLFSQRGDYSKALVYLSRLPTAQDGETVFTRTGGSIGFRKVRRASTDGAENLMAGIEEEWRSIGAKMGIDGAVGGGMGGSVGHGGGKREATSVKFLASLGSGNSLATSPIPLSIGGLPVQLVDTSKSKDNKLAPASLSVVDREPAGAEISRLLGRTPAGSGTSAALLHRQSSAHSVSFAEQPTKPGGTSVMTGVTSTSRQIVEAFQHLGEASDEAEGGARGDRPSSLLDAEALETALSRGAHATTDFTLKVLETATGQNFVDVAAETVQTPAAVKLTLRQQCALALREMSRDASARPAIIAQGGFRALLQVLLESEAGAAVESEWATDNEEATGSVAEESVAAEADGPPSMPGAAEKTSSASHRYDAGSVLPSQDTGAETVVGSVDASASLTTQPMTDTVMNCLMAICNLSAMPGPDKRQSFDEPWRQDPITTSAITSIEPGCINALAGLAPSVNGAARCMIITALFNFSCNRYLREQLVEEGAVSAGVALLTPELVHMKGMGAVPITALEARNRADSPAKQESVNVDSSDSASNYAEEVYSADEMDDMLAVASAASASGNPAGQHVRHRLQHLLRRLVKSVGQDISAEHQQRTLQQGRSLTETDMADSRLLLEDAYCLDVGIKLLCNLSGFPNGADALITMNALSTLASLWQWLAPSQQFSVVAHIVYNLTRTKLQARGAADSHAAFAACAVIDSIIKATRLLPVVGFTHDFVLRRAVLALCRMTLNPQACEHILWGDGARCLAAASLFLGTKKVVSDEQLRQALLERITNEVGQLSVSELDTLVECWDVASGELGRGIGIHPAEFHMHAMQAPGTKHPSDEALGTVYGSRYPNVLVQRKIAAALCRLAWGEPPTVGIVTGSDTSKKSQQSSAMSAQAAAVAGGWEKPVSMSTKGASEEANSQVGVPPSSIRSVAQTTLVDAAIEMDRDKERIQRVSYLAAQKHVIAAINRLLFSSDDATRKIAATGLCAIMRVPTAAHKAVQEGSLRALCLASHLGHCVVEDPAIELSSPCWKPGKLHDNMPASIIAFLASFREEESIIPMAMYNVSCHAGSRRDLLRLRTEEIAGPILASSIHKDEWSVKYADDGVHGRSLQESSAKQALMIAAENHAQEAYPSRELTAHDSAGLQIDANIRRSAFAVRSVAHSVEVDCQQVLRSVTQSSVVMEEGPDIMTARTGDGEAETDLPVVHGLLVIMAQAIDVITTAMPDNAFTDNKVCDLLSPRPTKQSSQAAAKSSKPQVLLPQESVEYVRAATALSFSLATLRNLSAEGGYQKRILFSGVIANLLAVLTPVALPPSYGRNATWCPFPLPCIGDAIHILANLSIDTISRQLMLQSGLLPALLPIASDAASSILMQTLNSAIAQTKLEYVRMQALEKAQQEESKRHATMAVALNASADMADSHDELSEHEASSVTVAPTLSISTPSDGPDAAIVTSPPATDPADDRASAVAVRRKRKFTNVDIDGAEPPTPKLPAHQKVLLDALSLAESNADVQYRCAALVETASEARKQCALALSAMAMAGASHHADRLLDLGVLHALVALCYFGREGDPIRDRITAAIQALTSDVDLGRELVKEGVIPALISLCGSSSEKVRKQCVGALTNLSRACGHERQMLDAGVVPALMVIALLRSNDPVTQSRCVFTVHNLLAVPECRVAILQQGFVWGLQKLALSKDIVTQRAVAVCIYRLASDPNSQSQLVRQGGLRSVISVLHKAYGINASEVKDIAGHSRFDEDEDDGQHSEIIAALREAAAADLDSKVGMTGVNTAPVQGAILISTERQQQAASGCDPVVASYFAGVLAAVSRVKGNEAILIAEGAVEALVVLCTAASSHVGDSPDIAPESQFMDDAKPKDAAETGDISKLRPSCALGLYNMSCAGTSKLRARVISGGAPGVFAQLASSPNESLTTRRLCVLGLCNLLWGEGAGPAPLFYAHLSDAEALTASQTALASPVLTKESGGETQRSAIMKAGIPKSLLRFAQLGDVRDTIVAACTLHYVSCYEDCHEEFVKRSGVDACVFLMEQALCYDYQCVDSQTSANETSLHEQSRMRLSLDAAMMASVALANVATHPRVSPSALFAISASRNLDSGSLNGGPFSPDIIKRIATVCRHACTIVAHLINKLSDRSLGGEDRERLQGRASTGEQSAENAEYADIERAAMLIDAAVSIFAALAHAPACTVNCPLPAGGATSPATGGRAKIPFPYTTLLIQGDVIDALHHVLIAAQLPQPSLMLEPSLETRPLQRLPSIQSFRVGERQPSRVGAASVPLNTSPSKTSDGADRHFGADAILAAPLPRRTVACAVSVLASVLAIKPGIGAMKAQLPKPIDDFHPDLFVRRVVALAIAAATAPGAGDHDDVSTIAVDPKQISKLVDHFATTHEDPPTARLSDADPAVSARKDSVFIFGSEEMYHRRERSLSLSKLSTFQHPLPSPTTLDTARMKAYADPSYAFAEQAADRIRACLLESFTTAVAREVRDACARILCHVAGEPELRSLLIRGGAPAALISLSKHDDCDPALQRACLRAICQLAIGVDPALPTTSGATAAPSPQSSHPPPAVIHSGAISALISVMESTDMPETAVSQSDADAASLRDVLTEYLEVGQADPAAWWRTVNLSDIVLHPHAAILWPMIPHFIRHNTSKGSIPAKIGDKAEAAGRTGADDEPPQPSAAYHPSSLDLNGIMRTKRATEPAFLFASAKSAKTDTFTVEGVLSGLIHSPQTATCLYTPSMNPVSRLGLLPLPCIYARDYALIAILYGPEVAGKPQLDSPALFQIKAHAGFIMGHYTFLCYDDAVVTHSKLVSTANIVEKEWRMDPKRAAVAAAASAESAANYAVSLVRQAAGSVESRTSDMQSTVAPAVSIKLKPDSIPAPPAGSIVSVDAVDLVLGKAMLLLDSANLFVTPRAAPSDKGPKAGGAASQPNSKVPSAESAMALCQPINLTDTRCPLLFALSLVPAVAPPSSIKAIAEKPAEEDAELTSATTSENAGNWAKIGPAVAALRDASGNPLPQKDFMYAIAPSVHAAPIVPSRGTRRPSTAFYSEAVSASLLTGGQIDDDESKRVLYHGVEVDATGLAAVAAYRDLVTLPDAIHDGVGLDCGMPAASPRSAISAEMSSFSQTTPMAAGPGSIIAGGEMWVPDDEDSALIDGWGRRFGYEPSEKIDWFSDDIREHESFKGRLDSRSRKPDGPSSPLPSQPTPTLSSKQRRLSGVDVGHLLAQMPLPDHFPAPGAARRRESISDALLRAKLSSTDTAQPKDSEIIRALHNALRRTIRLRWEVAFPQTLDSNLWRSVIVDTSSFLRHVDGVLARVGLIMASTERKSVGTAAAMAAVLPNAQLMSKDGPRLGNDVTSLSPLKPLFAFNKLEGYTSCVRLALSRTPKDLMQPYVCIAAILLANGSTHVSTHTHLFDVNERRLRALLPNAVRRLSGAPPIPDAVGASSMQHNSSNDALSSQREVWGGIASTDSTEQLELPPQSVYLLPSESTLALASALNPPKLDTEGSQSNSGRRPSIVPPLVERRRQSIDSSGTPLAKSSSDSQAKSSKATVVPLIPRVATLVTSRKGTLPESGADTGAKATYATEPSPYAVRARRFKVPEGAPPLTSPLSPSRPTAKSGVNPLPGSPYVGVAPPKRRGKPRVSKPAANEA